MELKRWTEEDDDRLRDFYEKKVSVKQIAIYLSNLIASSSIDCNVLYISSHLYSA